MDDTKLLNKANDNYLDSVKAKISLIENLQKHSEQQDVRVLKKDL